MNNLHVKALACSALIVALGFSAVRVSAGDKIVDSDNKIKAEDPNGQPKIKGDLFKSFEKLNQPGFSPELLDIPTIPRGLSRKEEKRLENHRIEQKNWLYLDSGDLQRKEEEKKTIFDDNTEADEKRTDYTFQKDEKKGSQRPGEARSRGSAEDKAIQARQIQEQRERESADSAKTRTFSLDDSKNGEKPGSHISSDLSFKNLFDPGKSDALISGAAAKSEFSLRDVLGGAPGRTKDQVARMDDFTKMINSSTPGASTFGMANPLSFSQPGSGGLPGLSRPLDSGSSIKPLGNDSFNPGASAMPSRLGLPGLPTIAPAATPGLGAPSVFQQPTVSAPDSYRNWQAAPEPVRRRF